MPDSAEGDVIRAAGAVVWRSGPAGIEFALVHRPRYDDWSYPKGKCRSGEHVLAAAAREVTEETGLRVTLGRPLRPSVYPVRGGVKHVSFWAAHAVKEDGAERQGTERQGAEQDGAEEAGEEDGAEKDGAEDDGAGPPRFVPSEEVDEVAWLPAGAAGQRLSYPGDVALLEEFLSAPVQTIPFILLRHAAAGDRAAGTAASAADLARPLDLDGVADARLLAPLLACFGRCRVISSPAERCVATVRPYAAAVGVTVRTEPAFTVPPPDVPAETARRRELLALAAQRAASLAAERVPTIVCAHRENLPALIDAVAGSLGALAPQGPPLGKGAFLVLHSAHGVVVSSERHEPTALAVTSGTGAGRPPRPAGSETVGGMRYKPV